MMLIFLQVDDLGANMAVWVCLGAIHHLFSGDIVLNILYRGTRRLRKLSGNEKLKCGPKLVSERVTMKDITIMTLFRPFTLNFTEPMVFLLNL
jgi:MFS transporter, DHA1 family, multidrug resistance protein